MSRLILPSGIRSPYVVDWRAADLSLECRTGQEIVFTRPSSSGIIGDGWETDHNGRLYQSVEDQPRWGYWGGVPHLLLEAERTNLCLQSEAMATTWTATNVTVATDDAIAPDGATTAEGLTASAGGGTLVQDLGTLSSDAYVFSIWLKRVTGSGDIDLTLDNGSTWTTVLVTSSWARYDITQTVANPDVGIRIVTSGDALHAWGGQCEAASVPGSYIPTAAATVTRAAETASVPFHATPGAYTIYEKWVEAGTVRVTNARRWQVSNAAGADAKLYVESTGTYYRAIHDPGAASTSTLATAWSGALLYLNSGGTSHRGLTKLREFRLALGTRTLDDMRVAA